jgi:hypothetical protein
MLCHSIKIHSVKLTWQHCHAFWRVIFPNLFDFKLGQSSYVSWIVNLEGTGKSSVNHEVRRFEPENFRILRKSYMYSTETFGFSRLILLGLNFLPSAIIFMSIFQILPQSRASKVNLPTVIKNHSVGEMQPEPSPLLCGHDFRIQNVSTSSAFPKLFSLLR